MDLDSSFDSIYLLSCSTGGDLRPTSTNHSDPKPRPSPHIHRPAPLHARGHRTHRPEADQADDSPGFSEKSGALNCIGHAVVVSIEDPGMESLGVGLAALSIATFKA